MSEALDQHFIVFAKGGLSYKVWRVLFDHFSLLDCSI